jgi:hypothetical protein
MLGFVLAPVKRFISYFANHFLIQQVYITADHNGKNG